MSRFLWLSAFLVLGLGYALLRLSSKSQHSESAKTSVRIYCAAGVVQPVEQLIASYNESRGGNVELARVGGSGELNGQIKLEFETGLVGGADLFVSADEELVESGVQAGMLAARFELAVQRPVIAVRVKGVVQGAGQECPAYGVRNLKELIETPGIKFGIASEQAAIGKMIREIARREGLLDRLEAAKATESENVMVLGQALVTGSLDAAVVWDATVVQINAAHGAGQPLLEIVSLADMQNESQGRVVAGVVAKTPAHAECVRFAEYLTSETGQAVFQEFGFVFRVGALD